jgi:hypothetical protein
MIKVNSVSGGKTSAYMAIHYPTDFNVFSLVTIEAKYCTPTDKNLVQYVSDKIGKEFIATAESDKTLIVVRDLEQQLGRSIYWVAGDTFEQVIRKKKALPNQMWRFCTSEMKMKPIFEFCQNRIKEVVEMNIGFRYDEQERGERNKTNTHFKAIVGQSENGRNKWKEIYWRELSFPMIDDRTTHLKVKKWADQSGLIFPEDSNCVGCFWKPFQQLRKNWNDEPLKMKWFSEMEEELGRTFKKEMSYLKTKKLGIQQDFNFGTGSGCSAGYCTD